MLEPQKIADYFSRVLKRGQLESVVFDKASTFIAVPREETFSGTLELAQAQKLFDAHAKKTKSAGPSATNKPLPVVVSLVSTEFKDAGHSGLLLISAVLHPDGKLVPQLDGATSPWIPADRLISKTADGLEVMVGPDEKFWHYLRTESNADTSQIESFADVLTMAEKLFTKVSGRSLEDFRAVHRELKLDVDFEFCYIQEHERINAVKPLLELYDFLSGQKSLPVLLERTIVGWDEERPSELTIHDQGGLYRSAKASCGSMSDEHPLTESQRRAVHAFLASEQGDVTAVSGPPGTGKTTMLQSIVANMVTRRALEKAPAPVIVGASTNNQAVTNIISSFASVTKDEPGDLDYRWLPREADGEAVSGSALSSLAVYCPSKGKLKESKEKYLVEQTNKAETYAAYSSENYLAAARDNFVFCAQKFFGAPNEIKELREWIHDALKELDYARTQLLSVMATLGSAEEFQKVCERLENSRYSSAIPHVVELKNCQSLKKLDEKLDVTIRYAQFWLAVHYFEAEWLLAEDLLDAENRRKNTPRIMDMYWRQAAALTPCFVMTLYQMPKYFKLFIKRGEPNRFDLERADLLIVDEAGQVDTPLSLPALALAKRAVIVGDEKQIPPVWNIDELTDQEVALGAHIPAALWRNDLQERGLTCSAPSSLMRAASYATKWHYGEDIPGLFLSEHFRCHPDIIGFCNELLYAGLLEPRRPAKASKLFDQQPAFQWNEVADSNDSPAGSSRQNTAEAKAIAQWIVQNYATYFEIYHHQEANPNKKIAEDQLIGVVTPFSAQARTIEQEIRSAAAAATGSLNLPENLANKITVGTAHRLQGAERPIVLFSATYGQNSAQAGFIDANHELINVAVSRAKDLFMVFAAANRWNNGPVFQKMANFATKLDLLEPCVEPELVTEQEFVEESVGEEAVQEPQVLAQRMETVLEPEDSLTATALLNRWKDGGYLRADDSQLNARTMNERLRDAGVLSGQPGQWEPTVLACLIGATTVERLNAKTGESFQSLEYTPQMQRMLLDLYQQGKL